jgi:hypothetical protein
MNTSPTSMALVKSADPLWLGAYLNPVDYGLTLAVSFGRTSRFIRKVVITQPQAWRM